MTFPGRIFVYVCLRLVPAEILPSAVQRHIFLLECKEIQNNFSLSSREFLGLFMQHLFSPALKQRTFDSVHMVALSDHVCFVLLVQGKQVTFITFDLNF